MRERAKAEAAGAGSFHAHESAIPSERDHSAAMPPVFTVASGKGGVGKSCLVANLGSMLARSGKRVLLVDGDFGLATLDILLGVQPAVTIEQVLDGHALIQEAILGVEPNLWLLPAAAGLSSLRRAAPDSRGRFLSLVDQCPWEMDVVLVDVGAGIQENVLSMHSPLFNSMVVLTPEPTSLTDAYGLIKLLRRTSSVTQVSVVVNQVTDGREAQKTFQKLKDVASRFVDVELEYLGHCQRDEKFPQAVMNRKILLDWDERSPAIASLELLARRILAKTEENATNAGFSAGLTGNTTAFWRTLLWQAGGASEAEQPVL